MTMFLKAGTYLEEPHRASRNHHQVTLLPLQGRSGYVFVFASLKKSLADGDALFRVLDEHIERLASSFGKEANAQHRFEQFLRALNEQLAEQVRDGVWHVPLEEVNAIVGIACDDQMYLSGNGNLTAIFVHRQPGNRYQVYNLSRSIQTEQNLPTWEKSFAVVLDGDLHPGDVFCVSNQELQRSVSNDDLLAILTTLPPEGAAEKIRQYYPHNADLAMLILQGHEKAAPAMNQAKPLSELSVEHLEKTEEDTKKLLEDQRPQLKSLVGKWLQKRGAQKKLHGAPARGFSRKLWRLFKTLASLILSVLKVFTSITSKFASSAGKEAIALRKKDAREEKIEKTKARVDGSIKRGLQRFNKLPSSSKYLVLAAIALVFVFGLTVSVLSNSKARTQETEAYLAQVEEAEAQIDSAAGAVIYKDEAKARELYLEAEELVTALPADTEDRQKTVERLRAEIQTGMDELRHIVNIPDPPEVADLSSLSEGVFGRTLFLAGDTLSILGTDSRLYQVSTDAKSVARAETIAGEGVGTPVKSAAAASLVYSLDDQSNVSVLDVAGGTLSATGLAPAANSRWTDIFVYADKLYLLRPSGGSEEGQIVRYTPSAGGFGTGTNWIQSNTTDLSDAVSLAVDGTIFVLKQNGQIARFVSGSEVGWTAGKVDPPVTHASDIWTDIDSKFVYVLEPSTQRLLVFDKQSGGFLLQYRSDKFSGMTDFLVDEDAKLIYLLAGEHLYAISASHL